MSKSTFWRNKQNWEKLQQFDCRESEDCTKLYCKSDTISLANALKKLLNATIETYDLEPSSSVSYFSALFKVVYMKLNKK